MMYFHSSLLNLFLHAKQQPFLASWHVASGH
jgi:hypothetical protein